MFIEMPNLKELKPYRGEMWQFFDNDMHRQSETKKNATLWGFHFSSGVRL
jgi:hypothetical protein